MCILVTLPVAAAVARGRVMGAIVALFWDTEQRNSALQVIRQHTAYRYRVRTQTLKQNCHVNTNTADGLSAIHVVSGGKPIPLMVLMQLAEPGQENEWGSLSARQCQCQCQCQCQYQLHCQLQLRDRMFRRSGVHCDATLRLFPQRSD